MPKVDKSLILRVLGIVLLLFIVVVTVLHSEPGVTCGSGAECSSLPVVDLSVVPPSVAENATELATELFGDNKEKCNAFINQMLSVYLKAKDKDFLMVFNSGGMGWKVVNETPGWLGISKGIESELTKLNYSTLQVNHLRTDETWMGALDEFVEMMILYPTKARDLAYRIQFLTDHLPNLRVIITGESDGTIIADRVMNILKHNSQVYSIQTGRPFWHKNFMLDRTLPMTNNGKVADAFSRGDILAMSWGTIKVLFGFTEQVDDGNILYYVRAPGHDYQWQYPGVSSEITNFLEQNFGIKDG